MYDCPEATKLIYPYLDGELDVEESLRFQFHLKDCPNCQEALRRDGEFLQTFQSLVEIPPAPAHLRERIRQVLKPAEPTSRGRSWFSSPFLVSTLAMLALALAGIILYALAQRGPKSDLELVRTAVENHEKIVQGKVPLDIMSSEPEVVLEWLGQRVDFTVSLPQDEASFHRLVGGKLIPFHDKNAAFLTFESGKDKVSLLMAPPHPIQVHPDKMTPFKNLQFYLTQYRGYYALAWTDSQLSYVLVSDQKGRVTEACRICHSGDDTQKIIGFENQI